MAFSKYATVFLCILLASMLSATVLGSIVPPEDIPPGEGEDVIPPSQLSPPTNPNSAVVIISSSVGGTTNPVPGSYEYTNGTLITMTATPQQGFTFLYWVIEGGYTATDNLPPIYLGPNDDPSLAPPRPAAEVVAGDRLVLSQNPLRVLCGYGWSFQYQAVFAPTFTATASADTVARVLSSIGGTTDPTSGIYTYPENTTYSLKAIPSSGFEFKYWVVTGDYMPGHNVEGQPELDATVITSNPLDVSCGYGYTYTYQPFFAPVGSQVGEGIPATTFYIVVVLAVIAIIVAVIAVYMGMKRSRK